MVARLYCCLTPYCNFVDDAVCCQIMLIDGGNFVDDVVCCQIMLIDGLTVESMVCLEVL